VGVFVSVDVCVGVCGEDVGVHGRLHGKKKIRHSTKCTKVWWKVSTLWLQLVCFVKRALHLDKRALFFLGGKSPIFFWKFVKGVDTVASAGMFCQKSPTFGQKSPIFLVERALCFLESSWNDTVAAACMFCQKSPIFLEKEPYTLVKRALYFCKKRLIFWSKKAISWWNMSTLWLGLVSFVKRTLYFCQKSSQRLVKKVLYFFANRTLHFWQKSPTCLVKRAQYFFSSKEPYISAQRALHVWSKEPYIFSR